MGARRSRASCKFKSTIDGAKIGGIAEGIPMAVVEIFHAKMCGACDKAKDFFRDRGINVTGYEVQWQGNAWVESENSIAMLKRCGDVDCVPQIFVNGAHIKGWRQLEPLIESGEIDKLLADN